MDREPHLDLFVWQIVAVKTIFLENWQSKITFGMLVREMSAKEIFMSPLKYFPVDVNYSSAQRADSKATPFCS